LGLKFSREARQERKEKKGLADFASSARNWFSGTLRGFANTAIPGAFHYLSVNLWLFLIDIEFGWTLFFKVLFILIF
jgi:hypothetical protein